MSPSPEDFVAARAAWWRALEAQVERAQLSGEEVAELAAGWRQLCVDLMEARELALPEDTQDALDALAARVHQRMYGVRPRSLAQGWSWLTEALPREVRASAGVVGLAHGLFYGPALVGGVAAWFSPELVSAFVSRPVLDQMAEMYATPANERSASENLQMFGFYVFNNVGIAFRCFATGIFAGMGTVFFLMYNGVVLGAGFGYLSRVGHGGNLLTFVSGHGPWELTGIVLAGAAGLRLGLAVMWRRGRTLAASLRAEAGSMGRLLVAASVALGVAAVIEGLWSASPVPDGVKWAFGVLQVGVVATWLLLGGRR